MRAFESFGAELPVGLEATAAGLLMLIGLFNSIAYGFTPGVWYLIRTRIFGGKCETIVENSSFIN